MRTTIRRVVSALATAAVLLAVSVSPAAAVTVDVEATGGTLLPGAPFGRPFELGPDDGTAPCEDKPTTLQLATDTPGAGQWTVTGGFTRFLRLGNPPTGPWYQVDYEVLAGTGTYSGSGSPYTLATSGPGHLILRMRIYAVDSDGGTCAKDRLLCTVLGRWVSTSGSFTGTLPSPAIGDVATLSLTTSTTGGLNLAAMQCSAPWTALNRQVSTITGLTLEVV